LSLLDKHNTIVIMYNKKDRTQGLTGLAYSAALMLKKFSQLVKS